MAFHPELSERLTTLFSHATNHGFAVIRSGQAVLPFLLTLGTKGPQKIVFTSVGAPDIVAQGIADAKRHVREHTQEIDAYVFGCDGRVKLTNGSAIDALILEGSESKLPFRFVFAEQYRKNEKGETVRIMRPGGSFARKDEQLLQP